MSLGEAEVGYMLDKQEQGNGYAAEALKTLATWAFLNVDTKCVIAHTPAGNLPSRKMLLKLGFTEGEQNQEGFLPYKLLATAIVN